MKHRQPEQQLQQAYVMWLRSKGILHCAIPGGIRTSIGMAVKIKRSGYCKGFPDIVIPIPAHGYHALFVELKATTDPKDEQKRWHFILREKGYEVIVNPSRRGFQESLDWLIAKTEAYLGEAC
jgi:hypothetical protein